MRKHIWVTALMVTMLACSLFASEIETPIAEVIGEAETALTEESSFPEETTSVTEAATGEATDVAPVETEAGCTLDARFVEDVTIPDGTSVIGGAKFHKTWRIRNAGTCDWEPGTQLVYASGDALGGPASVSAPIAASGTVVDVSVDFIAPVAPGSYRSTWQLQTAEGKRFGSMFYVKIVVPEAGATQPVIPTVTPTAEIADGMVEGCSSPYDLAFVPILDQVAIMEVDIGCPLGKATTASGAFQEFWANVENVDPNFHYRSLMIWTTPYKLGEIYVVKGSDTSAMDAVIKAAYDHWDESQPEIPPDCAGLEIPTGYLMPRRGFGKHWCEEELWKTVGWPISNETGIDLLVQRTENGQLMKVSGPNIYSYLVAWHYDTGKATVKIVGP